MVENIILKNTITNNILELSQDKTPFYVLQEVDWGQVQSTSYTYKYLNQTGESKQNTELGSRPVYIIGWVIGRTEEDISKRKSFLNMFVNPMQDLELYYNEYKLTFTPETSIKYGIQIDENNRKMCKFKIDGVAYNPAFVELNETFEQISGLKGRFHFPLIINQTDQRPPQIMFGEIIRNLTATIINKGQVDTGFRLVYVAKGTVINPVFYNINNQLEFFKLNKTLAPNEVVEINTNRGDRGVVGYLNGTKYNYSKYRDLDSTWLQLTVGENIFRYDADEGVNDLEVAIYYNDKYLEVQQCF